MMLWMGIARMVLILIIAPSIVIAHPGGLDNQGGHNNRKIGMYHCHKQPCYRIHQQSNSATKESLEENRAFDYVYSSEDWAHWSDLDNNCMNTRHEILMAQSSSPVKLSPDGCFVSKGIWNDPFSGKTLTCASDIDVDHIVPLKWAHSHGGANWPKKKKERFANDPANLLAVDDGLNQSKGAKGPTEWMPPNHSFRCGYLELWVDVLSKYPSLQMTSKESSIFKRQIEACNS